MPRSSPFTSVGRRLAELARPARADLHAHTTASDGEFTPSQLVALARRAGLTAVAVTDHDTLAGVDEARAAAGPHLEVIPGVEITAAFAGREVHLLGYFVSTDHAPLNAALSRLCDRRRERYKDFVTRLAIPPDRAELVASGTPSLGRRHVAGLLVAAGLARTRTEAFHRFLGPVRADVVPKLLLPLAEAIGLVHEAGGAASLAHPPADLTEDQFGQLAALGLDALEVEYPWGRNSPARRLRETAGRFGLAVTGGSDCHGPDPPHRSVGSHAVTAGELAALRDRCGGSDSRGPRS